MQEWDAVGTWLLVICTIAFTACDAKAPPNGTAYVGPIVSQQGLLRLEELEDKKLMDTKSELGGGAWEISIIRKTPHPVTGGKLGPVLVMSQGTDVRVIPIQSDGDVADLYKRATGTAPPEINEPATAPYLEAWQRGGRREKEPNTSKSR
jgi:hypothetical protein